MKSSHNFIIPNCDTDSISLCYPDFRFIDELERKKLIEEINSILPPKIQMTDDGFYPCVIIVKTKNYALYDGKKTKIKGSALKASSKSPALKEFIKEVIEIIIHNIDQEEMHRKLKDLYLKYVLEVCEIKDIKRWAARKTLSSTMKESERSNETKVMDALAGSNYVEGDRFYTYYKPDDSLCLVENFDGEYNKVRLFKNLYDTISVFETVLPVKELFPNYSLKKNQKIIENLT